MLYTTMNFMSPGFIKTALSILITFTVAVLTSSILRSLIKPRGNLDNRRGRTFVAVIRNTISTVIYLIALHMILKFLSIDITPLLASAGIIGLSIGLGAKPLIEDLIAGVMLLSQDSISVGDHVEIEGSVGDIEKLGFRTISIRAKDGSLHIIPNGMVKKVINFSRNKPEKKV